MRYYVMIVIVIIILCSPHFNTLLSQDHRFNLGFHAALNFAQIEGDNLRGFKDLGYSFGWIGGYKFNDHNLLLLSAAYESIGSNRNGAKTPRLSSRPLVEIDLKMVSIYIAYSRRLGDSWDGDQKFRYSAGLKLNNLLKEESKFHTGRVDFNPELTEADFKKRYVSLKISIGMSVVKNVLMDVSYEHSIQNILHADNVTPISKLVPFYLNLGTTIFI